MRGRDYDVLQEKWLSLFLPLPQQAHKSLEITSICLEVSIFQPGRNAKAIPQIPVQINS